MPAPRPVDQLAFLRNLQRLLAESRVVATYKYALLHALADIAVTDGDDSGDAMRIATRRIAEQFVDLYWRQVAPFPGAVGAFELLQNTGKQAAVISRVREQRQVGVSTPLEARLDAKRWRRLVGKIDATVRGMPLQRLQLLGEELVDFLYANPQSTAERSIVLKPGAAWCLRAFHDLVLQLARSGWIQHVRAINL